MSRVIAIALFAACSHNEPKPAEPAAPESTTQAAPGDPAPCEAVTVAILKTGGDTLDVDKVKNVILRQCKDDHWSPELRRCVVTATGTEGAGLCTPKFSRAQSEAYNLDMQAHGVTVLQPPPSDGVTAK